MFAETVGTCIPLVLTYIRVKKMMPMAQFVNTPLIPAFTNAASFAAHSVALLITGDASFATTLHNLQIED